MVTEMTISEQEFEFRRDVLERLAAIETSLKTLTGNGRPGAISSLFERVRRLEDANNRFRGAMAILTAIALIAGTLIDALARRIFH